MTNSHEGFKGLNVNGKTHLVFQCIFLKSQTNSTKKSIHQTGFMNNRHDYILNLCVVVTWRIFRRRKQKKVAEVRTNHLSGGILTLILSVVL